MDASEAPVLAEGRRLIDAWCDRRDLRPLAELLPAWTTNNGLTDGWSDVAAALRGLRLLDLPKDERETAERMLHSIEASLNDR